MKLKHLQVIIFSSVVIAVILASTLAGYSLYLRWKEDVISVEYRNSILKLTADIFEDKVDIGGIDAKFGEAGDDGAFSAGRAIVEWSMKNNTGKQITHLGVEISFLDRDDAILYRDWTYPLGGEFQSGAPFFSGMRTRKVLSPGESIRLEYVLRNCPERVRDFILGKNEFAKIDPTSDVHIEVKVCEMTVL